MTLFLWILGVCSVYASSFNTQNTKLSLELDNSTVMQVTKLDESITVNQSDLKTITGKVTDRDGLPLPGVSVMIKGVQQGTITDLNGNYSLSDVPQDATLVYSFIGMKTMEVLLNGKSIVNVTMEYDNVGLEEVIAIGYGTVNKKELTSAVSHVSSTDLLQSGGTNPLMSIQGMVSGLSITNTESGNPNSNPNIQLRGASSRDIVSSPLIVIDGVPGGNLENINQNDIASIDVLKDGAASAIYGTRGSAGVIIVTTKQGSSGAMSLTYNGYTSFGLANGELKSLSTEDYIKNERGIDFGGNTDWLKEVSRDFSFKPGLCIRIFKRGCEVFNFGKNSIKPWPSFCV